MLPSKISKLSLWFIIWAIIGFTDAFFIAFNDLRGEVIPCSILKGCDIVFQSKYSHLFGVPVALWGVIYYGILIVLITVFLIRQKREVIKSLVFLTTLGLLMSIWFVFLQLFIIEAVCLYCLISAGSSFLLFIFSIQLLRRRPA